MDQRGLAVCVCINAFFLYEYSLKSWILQTFTFQQICDKYENPFAIVEPFSYIFQ